MEGNYTVDYYYHVSSKIKPEDCCLKPKFPGVNYASLEPWVKKICVCPTITGCLSAVAPCTPLKIKKIKVFKSKYRIKGYDPFCDNGYNYFKTKYPVADAHITGEKWLLKDTKFKYIGYINISELPEDLLHSNVGDDDPYLLKEQKRILKKINKMFNNGTILLYK
jgi:hypothetical protein